MILGDNEGRSDGRLDRSAVDSDDGGAVVTRRVGETVRSPEGSVY